MPACSCTSEAAASGGGPVVFDSVTMIYAISLWNTYLGLEEEHGPEEVFPFTDTLMPQLRPRAVLHMLLRLARAAVRSWEHCHGRPAAPAARSGSVPCATTPPPQPEPPMPPPAVFHASTCAVLALTALVCAANHMVTLHPSSASQPYGSGAGGGRGGADGSGSGTEVRRSGSTCRADVSGGGGGGGG